MRGEGMAQRMRRGSVRQAERAAPAFDRELDDSGWQRPAPRSDEERSLWRERERTELKIDFYGFLHFPDDWNHPGLPPFAEHDDVVAGTNWRARTPQAQRLRNAQAGAIEQRQHGGIARQHPNRPKLACPALDFGKIARAGDGQRFGQAAGELWGPHRREHAKLTLALLFQNPGEGAYAGELP